MTRLTVGLVNNMPDSALKATESQFRALLDAAAPGLIDIRCTSMPEVPRGEGATAHIANYYWPLEDFLRSPPDALIITGTEPVATDLRDEPYWQRIEQLVDWARSLGRPSIWSCLAAHAAVLYLSGIARQRLPKKCCGIFRHDVRPDHVLTSGLSEPLQTPHSRWNDLPPNALREAGYCVLSAGGESGANIFVLNQGDGQMVFLQGHPEYDNDSLLKEYRRDIGRYVRAQQPFYPTLPHGYFSASAIILLEEFRQRAELNRTAQIMSEFPAAAVEASLHNTWRDAAIQLYRNWLKPMNASGAQMARESSGMLL